MKILKNCFRVLSYSQNIIPSPLPFTKLYKFLKPGFGSLNHFFIIFFFHCSLIIIIRRVLQVYTFQKAQRKERRKILRLFLITSTLSVTSIYISSECWGILGICFWSFILKLFVDNLVFIHVSIISIITCTLSILKSIRIVQIFQLSFRFPPPAAY